MAIHSVIAKQFSKHLMPGEEILATLSSDPLFEEENRFCVTNMRFLHAVKKHMLAWEVHPVPLTRFREVNFYLDEGILKTSIVFYRKVEEPARFRGVNKGDAREFMAALEYATTQNLELLSQQTKTCPECAEQVSFLAKRCKYCGYKF